MDLQESCALLCPPGGQVRSGQVRSRGPGALGAQGMKPFYFRTRFRSKLRQVSQGRAPGSQLAAGTASTASRAHRVMQSITKMSILHRAQQLPKLCCLHGEEAGFRLPPQRCLRIFEMVLVSPAAPLMGGRLPSILYHIYLLWEKKAALSLAMLPVPAIEVFAQETASEPSLFAGQLPEENEIPKKCTLKRGVTSYWSWLCCSSHGTAYVCVGAQPTSAFPL